MFKYKIRQTLPKHLNKNVLIIYFNKIIRTGFRQQKAKRIRLGQGAL